MECKIVSVKQFMSGISVSCKIDFDDTTFFFNVVAKNTNVKRVTVNPNTLIATIYTRNHKDNLDEVSTQTIDTKKMDLQDLKLHYKFVQIQTQQKLILDQIQDVKEILNHGLGYFELTKSVNREL